VIKVTRTSKDELTQQEWGFIFFERELEIVLNSYVVRIRPTKRHGWKVKAQYTSMGYDRDRMAVEIAKADVPAPDDVLNSAVLQVVGKIKIKAWL
jgi:hypothetical protein